MAPAAERPSLGGGLLDGALRVGVRGRFPRFPAPAGTLVPLVECVATNDLRQPPHLPFPYRRCPIIGGLAGLHWHYPRPGAPAPRPMK